VRWEVKKVAWWKWPVGRTQLRNEVENLGSILYLDGCIIAKYDHVGGGDCVLAEILKLILERPIEKYALQCQFWLRT
jgi:hypothetical protein